MENVQRYTWEDALIASEVVGLIPAGAVNTGLRLARVINWMPKDNRPSGLYWRNELAADVVGVSRATLFRNIKVLKAVGLLKEVAGNLLPVIPQSQDETDEAFNTRQQRLIDAHKSQLETTKSQSDTAKSQDETGKSQVDNPYSVDTYSEHSSSVDVSSDAAEPVSAEASTSPLVINKEDVDASFEKIVEPLALEYKEEAAQSQDETGIEKRLAALTPSQYSKFINTMKRGWVSEERALALALEDEF